MIAMVVDGLKKTGLKEFQVSIGHVDFIQGLMNAADLQEDESREVRTLITNRNFFGVEELLDSKNVKESVKEAFPYPARTGRGPGSPGEALRIAPDLNARLGVTRLQQIYRLLKLYGAEDHVTFDLSMSGSYGYYTGSYLPCLYIRHRRRRRKGRPIRPPARQIRQGYAVHRICHYPG